MERNIKYVMNNRVIAAIFITEVKMLKKIKIAILIPIGLLDAVFIMARNTAPRYVLLQPGDR